MAAGQENVCVGPSWQSYGIPAGKSVCFGSINLLCKCEVSILQELLHISSQQKKKKKKKKSQQVLITKLNMLTVSVHLSPFNLVPQIYSVFLTLDESTPLASCPKAQCCFFCVLASRVPSPVISWKTHILSLTHTERL